MAVRCGNWRRRTAMRGRRMILATRDGKRLSLWGYVAGRRDALRARRLTARTRGPRWRRLRRDRRACSQRRAPLVATAKVVKQAESTKGTAYVRANGVDVAERLRADQGA